MAPQPEWLEIDFYKVLDVSETASDADIRSAYRKLARTAHPDANDDAGAEERFKAITAAYDVLGDPDKRREYDELRRLGPGVFAAPPTSGFGDRRVRVNVDKRGDRAHFSDSGDQFGAMFADAEFGTRTATANPRTPGRRRTAARGRPGRDLATGVNLPFVDAVLGTTTSIGVTSDVTCEPCDGSGSAPGTGRRVCEVCGGGGAQVIERGGLAMRRLCARCQGDGEIVGQPCTTCGGSGRVRRRRDVRVRIPAGVDDGQTIRLPGRGEPGYDGGPPGDLYVTIEIDPHIAFGRVGDNLTLTVPITYPEAVLGADVTVPTLDGDTVTVRVPPGTPVGRVLRVSGRGVRKGPERGDLLLTIDIAVPTNPTEVERDLVERLADATATRPRTKWEEASR